MTENKNDTSSTSLTSSGLSSKKEKSHIPEYLQSVYKRRYLDPFLSKFFDDEWVAGLGNFFYGRKLTKIVTSEIVPGNDVLQLGIASGSFERNVASRMDSQGVYHIEDVSFAHIQAAKRRVSPWLNVEMKKRDFTIENDCRYDVVLGYFVLHELPDARKKATLKRAFNALKSRGKMIFIDYARPQKFHLLKYPVKLFNRLYEPFAESLWYNEIKDFAPETDKLIWVKKTFFGDMYQCVIAQRR